MPRAPTEIILRYSGVVTGWLSAQGGRTFSNNFSWSQKPELITQETRKHTDTIIFVHSYFFVIFPGPISLAGRLGREGAFNMVATHNGPRAAYLVSAEGHFFPRGRNPPPKGSGVFFPGW